jgi:hypothetical protein
MPTGEVRLCQVPGDCGRQGHSKQKKGQVGENRWNQEQGLYRTPREGTWATLEVPGQVARPFVGQMSNKHQNLNSTSPGSKPLPWGPQRPKHLGPRGDKVNQGLGGRGEKGRESREERGQGVEEQEATGGEQPLWPVTPDPSSPSPPCTSF